MSLDALKWAFDQDCNGDASTKFVLVALCNWANEAWEAYPSVAGLADKTCLDPKTVRACLSRLRAAGAITPTGDKKGSTKQIPVYHIEHDAESFDWDALDVDRLKAPKNGCLESLPKTDVLKTAESGCLSDDKATKFTVKDSQKRTTDTQGNHKRIDTKDTRANADTSADAFDTFWKAYPKHLNKLKAKTAWAKLNPSVDLQAQILEAIAVQRLSAQWQRDGGQFIPYASTWLNGQQWENEAASITPSWTPEQAAFVEAVAETLGDVVVPPSEWTPERAEAISGMLVKVGGDVGRAKASMEKMRSRIDVQKFGTKTFDWWAKSANRDRIRAGHFDREGQQ